MQRLAPTTPLISQSSFLRDKPLVGLAAFLAELVDTTFAELAALVAELLDVGFGPSAYCAL